MNEYDGHLRGMILGHEGTPELCEEMRWQIAGESRGCMFPGTNKHHPPIEIPTFKYFTLA
jgi:hypothetical protein